MFLTQANTLRKMYKKRLKKYKKTRNAQTQKTVSNLNTAERWNDDMNMYLYHTNNMLRKQYNSIDGLVYGQYYPFVFVFLCFFFVAKLRIF